MFRLGIIGSDNSHADAFSKLANLDEGMNGLRIKDVQVTHIYGTDPARTDEVARNGRIPNIVGKPEEMIGAVDGVLCVWRHGGKHLPDALPCIEAGIPAFIDKPLACSIEDATALIDAAEKSDVGLTSFSTLRFAESTVEYIAGLKANAGQLTAGMSTGPADLESEYGGVFFYGIHAVELMNAVWGYGCQTVSAIAHQGNVVATCTFANGALVAVNLLGNAQYTFHLVAFGKDGWKGHAVDAGTCYYDGMQVFMEVLRSGQWNFTRDELLEPVKILCAIDRSLEEGGRTVALDEL